MSRPSPSLTIGTHVPETPWVQHAACRGMQPAVFYSEDPEVMAQAKAVCTGCVIRPTCLEQALARRELFGVWGGHDPTERRSMLRFRRRVA